jgi:hypothetical protein
MVTADERKNPQESKAGEASHFLSSEKHRQPDARFRMAADLVEV